MILKRYFIKLKISKILEVLYLIVFFEIEDFKETIHYLISEIFDFRSFIPAIGFDPMSSEL